MSRLCLHDVDEWPHIAEVGDHLRVGFMRLVFIVESVFEPLVSAWSRTAFVVI